MKTKLLCTLGPSSFNERVIRRLDALGVSLFRLNLSHTKARDAARIIRFVQATTSVPLSLDTEGAQIRTGDLVDRTIEVRENRIVRAHRRRVPGDARDLNLYPPDIIDELVVGDFIHIDADVLVQVIDVEPDAVAMRVVSGGTITQNKAVTVERDIRMPPLTDKDLKILAIGRELGIQHVALSFANRAADVGAIRQVAGNDVTLISKIECRAGLVHLDEIARASDAILIDRGDLSREVPIEQIPPAQKEIIRRAHAAGKKVYVATNLMESMTTLPLPTRAEVNDVFNTLMDGADGLVLAGETAVGKYPIGCASMILKIISHYEASTKGAVSYSLAPPISLLVEPHGGRLVSAEKTPAEAGDLGRLPRIAVGQRAWIDCEEIAVGTYSPLSGFMDRETLWSVLERHRLPDGTVWPMPVLLPLGEAPAPAAGARVVLTAGGDEAVAIMTVREVFSVDPHDLARRWFGTASADHEGAARVLAGGGTFVAGDVALLRRFSGSYRNYVLTPVQTRLVFAKKGWNRVVGFQTRNVPHRVHEHLQLLALEISHADGLYVCAEVGPGKPGAFLPSAVVSSYQTMLQFGRYPPGKVVFGAGASYRRLAGPREAVFQALCHKNLGCSHTLVGHDCGGAGDLYPFAAVRALFDDLGDLGVTPVFFEEFGYDAQAERYVELDSTGAEPVRSDALREALREDRDLPEWFLRDLIQEVLRAEMAAGRALFREGELAR
jgi:pyruvate kinase